MKQGEKYDTSHGRKGSISVACLACEQVIKQEELWENPMTETEAITLVKEQFSGASGFVARLRRGEGIDEAGVARAREALLTLKEVWAPLSTVPKEAILPLVDVGASIRSSIALQPELRQELLRLAGNLTLEISDVFAPAEEPMSEEDAMFIVRSQLSGDFSFLLALHHHEEPEPILVELVKRALETLQRAWAKRANIPKAVVGPMLDAPDAALEGYASFPPEVQRELERLSQDLREAIKRCLM